ncbi:MAG TPA: ABC transporter permease [Candidatus Copromonas avistercoris]|nr:ABC transporter permease [Candidatus Copromonas avistercoris]
MIKFIIKRLVALIPVLIGVSLLVFFILDLAPGDPAKTILGEQARPEDIAALREEMGLDDPFFVRYGRYMWDLVHGDLGTSYKTRDPVGEEVWARLPNTFKLAATSTIIAIILALPLGVIAAIKQNTLFDGVSMFISLLGISIPIFWFGLLLILLFSVTLGWFPVSGADQGLKSLVLPSLALGFQHMAAIARTTRSSMLEQIRQDYIRTVRAKGLPEGEVITKHALRNALIPTTTVIGLQMGGMLGGSVLTESVFAWPGIGRYMVQSIQGRDIPSVMGCIIIFAISFALINLLVDLIYGFIDPRIKAQYK